MTVPVLDIPLFDRGLESAVSETIESCLSEADGGNKLVSATGAHGLVHARGNKDFALILKSFYRNLPDGMPSVWIGRLKGVEIVGRRSRDEVFELMKGARFLVFPSEWYETFGMTIGEAFACGLPVLASRLGAITEIVEGGRTGIHFTPGDPEDLAVKVEWAWTHEKEMQEMGKEARRGYEMKYTAERNYTMLMDIYRLAIERVRKRYGASAGRN